MLDLIRRLPLKTILLITIVWAGLIALNCAMLNSGIKAGTPVTFPISVLCGINIHWFGLPYTLLFLVLFFLAMKHVERLRWLSIWAVGFTLIVLGNLAQGGIDEGFYRPFYAGNNQYCHDAIRVKDWRLFLSEFEIHQTGLTIHARVHPPFAILFHSLMLRLGQNSLPILAGSFTVLASLTLVLVWKMMRILGMSRERSASFTLLVSVIPAFNIYSGVCLDGVICAFAAMFLLGVVKIIKQGVTPSGILLLLIGFLATNMLTFAGLFLAAVGCLIASTEILFHRKYGMLTAMLIVISAGMLSYLFLLRSCEYDHVKAFLAAAKFENPRGFYAFHRPIKYLMTRIENVSEIALFLSLGVLAVLFHRKHLGIRIFDLRDRITGICLAGLTVLFLMFITGSHKTGETARSCLYIYPFILLILRNVQEPMLRSLVFFAGIQTIVMQSFGAFFW